ncbi:MAG: hypothetical protein V4543_14060 [Bacteroidota bacterium]
MILTWFTNPGDNKFSSYYQYDTIARKFVGIRLDVSEASGSGEIVLPKIVYCKPKTVLVNGKELANAAQLVEGAKISCFTPGSGAKPYTGYAITKTPVLPAEISLGHLILIAGNEMLVNETNLTTELSHSNLPENLSGILAGIMGKPLFECATDELTARINDMIWELEELALDEYREKISEKLELSVKDALNQFYEEAAILKLVPYKEVADAIEALKRAVNMAQRTLQLGDIEDAILVMQESITRLKHVSDIRSDLTRQTEMNLLLKSEQALLQAATESRSLAELEKQAKDEYELAEVKFENEELYFQMAVPA